MRIVLALFVGILGIVIGYCSTASIGYWLAGLAGMSDFEGGRAMFAAFFLGPIGALLGLVVGCIAGWKLGASPLSANGIMLLFLLSIGAFGVIWGVLVMG